MQEKWIPRGLGVESNLDCFVSGVPCAKGLYRDNCSGFVDNKEAGERIVGMFNGLARLDYRPHEPAYIQVKIGALPQYRPVLARLCELVTQNGGMISPEIIEQAKQPSPTP